MADVKKLPATRVFADAEIPACVMVGQAPPYGALTKPCTALRRLAVLSVLPSAARLVQNVVSIAIPPHCQKAY